jgi:hypothetical protein
VKRWEVERFSRGCKRGCLLLKRGRSAAFADPDQTAIDARHVWLPEAHKTTLLGLARRSDGPSSIFFPALPSLEHLLVEANGRQNVVLRANRTSLQFPVEGDDLAAGPVTMSFLVHGFGSLSRASDELTALRRIVSETAQTATSLSWTPGAQKLRDAFVTLDGRVAQASYREIAVVLYGHDHVERNWETGLKERMRRHLKRGLDLTQGRYRELLR